MPNAGPQALATGQVQVPANGNGGTARTSAAESIARIRAMLADASMRVPNASLQLIKAVGARCGRVACCLDSCTTVDASQHLRHNSICTMCSECMMASLRASALPCTPSLLRLLSLAADKQARGAQCK